MHASGRTDVGRNNDEKRGSRGSRPNKMTVCNEQPGTWKVYVTTEYTYEV